MHGYCVTVTLVIKFQCSHGNAFSTISLILSMPNCGIHQWFSRTFNKDSDRSPRLSSCSFNVSLKYILNLIFNSTGELQKRAYRAERNAIMSLSLSITGLILGLLCNDVFHWLGASLESNLHLIYMHGSEMCVWRKADEISPRTALFHAAHISQKDKVWQATQLPAIKWIEICWKYICGNILAYNASKLCTQTITSLTSPTPLFSVEC